jgi:hypothetical protein
VQNQTRTDIHLEVEVVDMEEGAGNSSAFEYVPIGEARRGAGAWIEAIKPPGFDIEAAHERAIPVVVTIPDDAGAGGYYAALVFTAKDPRPKAQVPIDQRVPVPVLVTVAGNAERDLRVSIEPDERWHWSGGTATWTIQLENAGDVHEVIAGRVRIDGALSTARSRPIKPGILLPGERRRQHVTFDLRDAPDLVGAELRVERDEGDAVEDGAPKLVVLPWWLLVLLALAIAVIWWRLRARRGSLDESWDSDEDEGSWGPSAPAG